MIGKLIFTAIAAGVVIYGIRQDEKELYPACFVMIAVTFGMWMA